MALAGAASRPRLLSRAADRCCRRCGDCAHRARAGGHLRHTSARAAADQVSAGTEGGDQPWNTFRAVVSYDGADFYGMQRQPRPLERSRTVQGSLEAALVKLLGGGAAGSQVKVTPAGRTDSGVHATGQVVSFSVPHVPGSGTMASFRRGFNALLPPDVRVTDLRPAEASFSARFDAVGKTYVYTIDNAPDACPLLRRVAAHMHIPMDVQALSAGAAALLGTHDFSAFANVSADARDPVKLITACDVDGCSGGRIDFRVTGSGFLYRQVRNMVGALLRVGTGALPPAQVATILASGVRPDWLKAAPAHGLCLHRVYFAGDEDAPQQLVEFARARDARWAEQEGADD
jgi:tRNA pseudouridine38-40 synthase